MCPNLLPPRELRNVHKSDAGLARGMLMMFDNRARWCATPGAVRRCPSPTPSPKALLIPSEAENPRWKQRGFFLSPTYYWVMNQNDDKLRALLRQWRDIEPRGNFEANVWRQIRTAAAERRERVSLVEAMGRLLWRPAWSVAAAITAAV